MSSQTAGISETESKIRQYLAANSLAEFGKNVTDETNLFKQGYLDSYGYVELIQYLEKEFKIKFTNEELVSNQLNSLRNITNLVQSKLDGK